MKRLLSLILTLFSVGSFCVHGQISASHEVSPSATTSQKNQIVIPSSGYTTLFHSKALILPKDVIAGAIKGFNTADSTVYVDWLYKAEDIVPAYTALILRGNVGEYPYNETTKQPSKRPGYNLLRGVLSTSNTFGKNVRFYRFGHSKKGFGFGWVNEDGGAFQAEGHSAYLAIPNDASENMPFFVLNDDPKAFCDYYLEYANGKEEATWYTINNTAEGNENKCISAKTEIDATYPLTVTDYVENDHYQQWKIEKDALNGKLKMINRATNEAIVTDSKVVDLYNVVYKAADAPSIDAGWMFTYLGNDQFTISGKESDGNLRFLCNTEEGQDIPTFDKEAFSNTAYAWKFKKIEVGTGIDNIAAGDNVKISVENHQVKVSGNETFLLYNLKGMRLANNSRLIPNEIYIVKTAGQAYKILGK